MDNQQLASEWRKKEGYTGKGGVIVICQGEVSGWVNELRDPKHWEPGCVVAVDEEGNQWEAQGGDPYHGAKRWEPVTRSKPAGQESHAAYLRNKYDWMTEEQWECFLMLCDLFGGEHHLSGKVKPHGAGIEHNTSSSYFATWDFNYLTRAVVMAHDRCIRFEIEPSGPGRLRLVLHKRQSRTGRVHERHPTIEEAITTARSNKGQPHPVTPGYLLVPLDGRNGRAKITSEMKAACIGEHTFQVEDACGRCLLEGASDDCEYCGGEEHHLRTVPVPWNTAKQIYKDMAAVAAET